MGCTALALFALMHGVKGDGQRKYITLTQKGGLDEDKRNYVEERLIRAGFGKTGENEWIAKESDCKLSITNPTEARVTNCGDVCKSDTPAPVIQSTQLYTGVSDLHTSPQFVTHASVGLVIESLQSLSFAIHSFSPVLPNPARINRSST
jgi:hypothetical protein